MKPPFTTLWLALLLVLLVFTSCEKPLLTDSSDESKPIGNLTVNVFNIEQTSFESLTRLAAADVCTRLSFNVYKLDGTLVKNVNQVVDDDDFGTASFQLDKDDYQLVVFAHSSNGNPSVTNPAKIQFTNTMGFSDTFLSNNQVTIGDDPVVATVSLNRIVALCRFVITDDKPDNVTRMRFYYTGGSGAFDANTGFGVVNSKQTVWFEDLTADSKLFDLYTILRDTTGNIHLTVSAYDENDNVLYEREFDVPLEQNKITWLSGPYFTGTTSNSFTVNINTDWAGESHLTF